MGFCSYCGAWGMMTRDHVVPKSRGGTCIVPACHRCNCSKGDLDLWQWLQLLPLDAPQQHYVPMVLGWLQMQ